MTKVITKTMGVTVGPLSPPSTWKFSWTNWGYGLGKCQRQPVPVRSPAKEGASPGRGGGASQASLAPHRIMIRASCTHLHGATRIKVKNEKKKAPCISSTVDSRGPGSLTCTIAEIPTTQPDSATPVLFDMQGTVVTPVPACRPRRFRRAGAELKGLFLLLRWRMSLRKRWFQSERGGLGA